MAQEMDKLSRILKRKRRRRAMMFAFISVVLVVAALVLLNIFCVVDVIKVNNETEYDTGEVLAKAGIFTGNQMLTMNPNDLESVIEKGFPYIDSAKVEIILPKTVSLSLISTIPYMALDQADGTYIYVDKSFKILECSEEKDENVVLVTGMIVDEYELGDFLSLDNSLELNVMMDIMNCLESNGYLELLDSIDFTKKYNTIIKLDGRIEVELGTSDDINKKIEFMSNILEKKQNDKKININVKNYSQAHYREFD